MYKVVAIALIPLLAVQGRSQSTDTAYIKKMVNFKQGKVNFLEVGPGKQIKVLEFSKSLWREAAEPDERVETAEDIDTSSAHFEMTMAAARRSYTNPNLTQEQKDRIKQNRCKNNKFAGLSRSGPKTSLASGNNYSYTSLSQFIHTLVRDEDMPAIIDALSAPWKDRAIQEMKNVTLSNVYLLAYAREDDNDYHLILTNSSMTVFFNAEISAMPGPNASSYNVIRNTRQVFENTLGVKMCGGYYQFEEPLLIKKLKGSIFFDTDHPGGTVGPQGFRPKTAWEIHPISYIEF